MEIQLTPEDKKSLLQYFTYIRSFGETSAYATCYFEYGSFVYGGDVYVSGRKIEKFKTVELLMERILNNIDPDKFEDDEFHDQDVEYFSVDFDFDCLEKSINVNCNYSVNGSQAAGSSGEIPEVLFTDLREKDVNLISCTYDGGGDSGYIDSYMNVDGAEQPTNAEVEDYCYTVLEDFSGWEINEGSQGEIILSLKANEYSVQHTWNTEEPMSFEIMEIKI